MKESFYGYYPPTTEQYEHLWKDGLIVLDTNVLLNLYRLPTTAQDELFDVLKLLKERLWIPHQVALEFQRRRLTVIASERKDTEEALKSASDLVDGIKKKVITLEIEKRGLGIDAQALLSDLEKANSELIKAIKATHDSLLDISSEDPVRQLLDELFENRVGIGPGNQGELDILISGGDDRYKEKIPPGFSDREKDKNPTEAVFMFDHIKYQRKFGDLILWRQLIQHVKNENIKAVLLITADTKEDWWWREQGKTIGPHPEMIREIKREGSVDLFWMYAFGQFVEHANKYASASVSSASVAEIQQVVHSKNLRVFLGSPLQFAESSEDNERRSFFAERPNPQASREAVERWLSHRGHSVEFNAEGFPSLLVRNEEDTVHGYEIKFLRHFDRGLSLSPLILNNILRGYIEIKEGRLSGFTLLIIIPQSEFFEIHQTDSTSEIHIRLTRLLSKYPIDSIIVGAIIEDEFQILAHQEPNGHHG